MSNVGATLIQAKDTIHTNWFALQQTKRSDPENAFLNKVLYDTIIELGQAAVSQLKEAEPDSRWIEKIENDLHEVEWKSWVADETRIGPTPYYVMTPERGQAAITQDINRLANTIHRAGMNSIKRSGQYCGCDLVDIEDLSSINTGVLRYCEGTLRLGHKRGTVFKPGDKVEHHPGAVTRHANTIIIEPTVKGYDLDIEYGESGDGNWRLRKQGVLNFIEGKGGQCAGTGVDLLAKCKIEDASEEDILELALLISQMKDIDLMQSECIPLAFGEVEKQIKRLKQIEPKESIWSGRWTRASEFQSIEECEQKKAEAKRAGGLEQSIYEELRATREKKAERIGAEIELWASDINYAIAKSKTDPCTRKPYSRLDDVDYIEDIRSMCQRIKIETDQPWAWCLEVADERERETKDAAKELVDRCPPEGIILGLEAGSYPGYACYEIEQVSEICQLAENQDCLDIIKQVLDRSEAGVIVRELPFPLEVVLPGE